MLANPRVLTFEQWAQIKTVFAGCGRDADAGHGRAGRHDVRLVHQLTRNRGRLHDARPTHDERDAVTALPRQAPGPGYGATHAPARPLESLILWLTRGVLWNACERVTTLGRTILITAFLFAFMHGVEGDLLVYPHRFVGGLTAGWLRHCSRSLHSGIVEHFTHNLLCVVIV